MANLDLKFYWAVFLRRLPYFLVIAALLLAVGAHRRLHPAAGLPLDAPACWSSRSRSRTSSPQTTVPVEPLRAGADHRAAADDAGQPARRSPSGSGSTPTSRRCRPAPSSATCATASSSSASPRTPPSGPTRPGATIIGVAFEAPTAGARQQGRQRAGQPGAAGERAAPHRPRRRHAGVLPGARSSGWRASSSASPRRSPTSRPPTSRRCPTA